MNSLRPGAVGVEFGVNSLFKYVASFSLSGKWHTGRATAIRLGGGASFQETQGDGSASSQNSLGSSVSSSDDHEELRSYSAFAQLVQYIAIHHRIGMFLAGGPIYHWNSTHDTEHFVSDGGDVVLQFDTSGWTTGLDLGIGFEWFFQNRLSMGARYGVAGLYGKSTIDRSETESGSIPAQDSIYQDSSHDKTFTFQTDETLVTLTAYF